MGGPAAQTQFRLQPSSISRRWATSSPRSNTSLLEQIGRKLKLEDEIEDFIGECA